MENINKKHLFATLAMFFAFVVFMILSMLVDVRNIAADGSNVGFGAINSGFFSLTGYSDFWYTFSELLGSVNLGIAFGFALVGVVQLVKRKSLKKIDYEIYLLAVLYLVTIILYVLFDKLIVINNRPVVLDGEIEASFPSSHTMLAIVVLVSAYLMFSKYLVHKEKLAKTCKIVTIVLMAVSIVSRTLSGVHWLTDIVGGVLLGTALVMAFALMWEKN